MPNIAHTTVEATGPAEALEALLRHVRPTAQGRLDFTLSPLAHPDPAPDSHLSWANLDANDERVILSVGLRHDMDCLFLAERLAQRFPALRVLGYLKAECDRAAFQAVCFEGGVLAYKASFDEDAWCAVPFGKVDGHYRLVRFFGRTPDRSRAALDHIGTLDLSGPAAQPAAAGGWQQVTAEHMGPRVFWRGGVAGASGQALVLDADNCTVLHDVDQWGGYSRKEEGDAAAASLPELAGEITRHRQEHEADLEACRRFAAEMAELDCGPDEIPF